MINERKQKMDISFLYSDIALIIYELLLIGIMAVWIKKLYHNRKQRNLEYEKQRDSLNDELLKIRISNEKRR